jgi:hypothetical protein
MLMNSAISLRIETLLLMISEFEGRVGSITSLSKSFANLIKLGGRLASLVEASLTIAALIELKKFS